MSDVAWKPNWEETKQHFVDWWKREGTVVTVGGPFQSDTPHEDVEDPGYAPGGYGTEEYVRSPELCARVCHYGLSRMNYPFDNMPQSSLELGPGTLSVYLGAHPVFDGTVWYEPYMTDEDPSGYAPIKFDPEQEWWRITERTARIAADTARGKYLVACPDLIENIDTLASLRGTHQLLVDMADRPEWVEERLWEINQAFFDVYDRIYDAIKLPDGSASFGAFQIWGPGKTAKVQCDASAMFSPAMFDRFVVPALTEQCEWLDFSLFHLDGSQCLCQLDSLLGIEALDGIEWTPDPTVPHGGDACWHELYNRILAAGKCVQAVGIGKDDLQPLLDACGAKGMYICTGVDTLAEADELAARIDQYR